MNAGERICSSCGCKLHMATTPSGAGYWASNSGSSCCPWPAKSVVHNAVVPS